jgi:Na+/melibiose symporter-like transporter
MNDLAGACWFNYLFYYLKRVVETPASNAALLAGQICDGIATPLVGYFSDKYDTRWGRRTPWYIWGWVVVFLCYIPMYQGFTGS